MAVVSRCSCLLAIAVVPRPELCLFVSLVRQDVLNDVWRVVNAAYVDPTFNGQDWKAIRLKVQLGASLFLCDLVQFSTRHHLTLTLALPTPNPLALPTCFWGKIVGNSVG